MANSTTIVTDLTSVATNGPSTATQANANNANGLSTVGGSNGLTGGSGAYASASTTFYGGEMDYLGMVQLAILKAKELAILLTKIAVNTDQASDSTNQALIIKVLNDLQ